MVIKFNNPHYLNIISGLDNLGKKDFHISKFSYYFFAPLYSKSLMLKIKFFIFWLYLNIINSLKGVSLFTN